MQNYQVLELPASEAVSSEPPPAAPEQPEAAAPFPRPHNKNAFRTGLVYAEPEYRNAYDLTQSAAFHPIPSAVEREPITCIEPIARLLDELVDAGGAFFPLQAEYQRLEALCRAEDGLIHGQFDKEGRFRHNPILEDHADRMKPVEDTYWLALERLTDAVEVETVVCMKEALSLAGVSDPALTDEICRCVIKGGSLWDWKSVPAKDAPESKDASIKDVPERPQRFTPCEASAPSPPLCRPTIARLETLPTKHEPALFPKWRRRMEERGEGPDVNPCWGQAVAYLASLHPFFKGDWEKVEGWTGAGPLEEKRRERFLTLLLKLVIKGCRKRGEIQ